MRRRFLVAASSWRCCAPFQCELSIASVKVVRHRIGLFWVKIVEKFNLFTKAGVRLGWGQRLSQISQMMWQVGKGSVCRHQRRPPGLKPKFRSAVYAALKVSSSMTSFTKRSGTSFTLQPQASQSEWACWGTAALGLTRRSGCGGRTPECGARLPAAPPLFLPAPW